MPSFFKASFGSKKPTVDKLGRTELHYAALENKVDLVRSLLAAGADPSAKDKTGWTPLHAAAQGYSTESASLLIQHRAQIDAEDAHGNTPLFRAVFESKGRGDLIALLRKAGADPNHKNRHGVSPLSLSRTIANYDVARFFSDLP
jgi:ankyrin repeat protein